jgi:hypothetical protein
VLIDLTKKYISLFDSKNLQGIEALLHDNFILKDPIVKLLSGKASALAYISDLFDSAYKFRFYEKNIFVAASGELIVEFVLEIDDAILEGVDILVWKDGRLLEVRAYLDVPK